MSICPHCGKETEEKRNLIPKTDWQWTVAGRLRFLEQCDCGFQVIDCTDEIFKKIEKHSWQKTKKET